MVVSEDLKALIDSNLKHIRSNIENAAKACGRDPGDITLVAVSKTKPAEYVMAAYELGCRDFGENRVQEIKAKAPILPDDIRWHMIGHLQRNKVKDVVGKVALIHSVDSYELAAEISRISVNRDVCTNILLEINPWGEDTKTGIKTRDFDGITDLVRRISELPGISIKGLMTVPPIDDDMDRLTMYFKSLRELSEVILKENINGVSMSVLSMGMTGDYETAIAQGSTHVRVGTGIFGERGVY